MLFAVVDDEIRCCKEIERLLKEHFPQDDVVTYTNVISLLKEQKEVDLLLLDLEMPEIDGKKFVETQDSYPNIIYVSSHDERVFDVFSNKVLGFVSKQKLKETLIPTIEEKFIHGNIMKIVLHTSVGDVEVLEKCIIYFHSKDTMVTAYTSTKVLNLTITSLKQLDLNETLFLQVNRNHCINLRNIYEFHAKTHEIVMSNMECIKVSRRNWTKLLTAYRKGIR